ncbi:MAG: hypothetical protein LBD68_06760 [Zoogloeaceae bacterium]|jgi:hypothetical protein|nr:hypothetical protein [Zoogloeaceae bacterium]
MKNLRNEGGVIREETKNLILEFMRSYPSCQPGQEGATQSDIFRECGFDWGNYETASSSNQQYWLVAALRQLEEEGKVERIDMSKKWRLCDVSLPLAEKGLLCQIKNLLRQIEQIAQQATDMAARLETAQSAAGASGSSYPPDSTGAGKGENEGIKQTGVFDNIKISGARGENEVEVMKGFQDYLRDSRRNLRGWVYEQNTVYAYTNSVKMVREREVLTWDDFVAKIGSLVAEYGTGGAKQDIGEEGHRTVINALKRFEEYIAATKAAQANQGDF